MPILSQKAIPIRRVHVIGAPDVGSLPEPLEVSVDLIVLCGEAQLGIELSAVEYTTDTHESRFEGAPKRHGI